MITIKDNSLCCGCMACVQVCPKQCIRVYEDREGFLYPKADKAQCNDCGRCESVCPELQQNAGRIPLEVYAAFNPDEEIRRQSSSGGIFTLLAESVIDEGGVVFGARFDEYWEVMHDYTETKEGLAAFRGSKYMQSRTSNAYRQARQFLQAGRKVLFTGTPCQIAGLKGFLKKEYENLLTVDFVCHGVPSPKIWRMYLDEAVGLSGKQQVSTIKDIRFRNKKSGWKRYSLVITTSQTMTSVEEDPALVSEVFTENPFMKAFLGDLILRPSCYRCPSKAGKSGSDITIGDFWGIEKINPGFDDDKGCNLVMLNNEKGVELFCSLQTFRQRMTYSQALAGNPSISHSVSLTKYRDFFFRRCDKKQSVICAIDDRYSMRLRKRVLRFLQTID